jgi:AcrR family transcriptional regulator
LPKKRTQERGRLRRTHMVTAARKLLFVRELDEIALTDIADAADIPKSSAYHLFPTAFDVHAAAAQEIAGELELHMRGLHLPICDGWADFVGAFIRHGARFFNDRRDAMQLLLGPKSPPAIKTVDREKSDLAISRQMVDALSKHYILPDWISRDETFFRAIEIADLFFSLSVLRCQRITEEYVAEAVRATNAYLALYIPAILPPAEEFPLIAALGDQSR